ncbi:hypothetical protein L0669_11040 [Flavobacterium bizetiae]|uniref:hypothetical protein n=1 Tax=Flavobacterium bizetiae TaxID=2704140 RepID=UPI0021E7EE79|nr:hypothetical protein [Flavobacterium bizetiae]UTN06419.1 hypothetical protein L0669_11040 [Flavobacterium bizetiae]
MKITIALSVLFLSFTTTLFSQTLADLKLKNKEIPKGYTFNDGNICVTLQACNFYTDIETLLES